MRNKKRITQDQREAWKRRLAWSPNCITQAALRQRAVRLRELVTPCCRVPEPSFPPAGDAAGHTQFSLEGAIQMKASLRMFSLSLLTLVCATALAAQSPRANPSQQAGAAQGVWAAPPSVGAVSTTPSACGTQPLCYDTPDFAVAVVDFRMSLSRGAKVMDLT